MRSLLILAARAFFTSSHAAATFRSSSRVKSNLAPKSNKLRRFSIAGKYVQISRKAWDKRFTLHSIYKNTEVAIN
jgi:hypothetical protein